MPSVSKKQRRAMAIAEHHPGKLYGKNKGLLKMTHKQLHDFASTKEKNLPTKKKAKKSFELPLALRKSEAEHRESTGRKVRAFHRLASHHGYSSSPHWSEKLAHKGNYHIRMYEHPEGHKLSMTSRGPEKLSWAHGKEAITTRGSNKHPLQHLDQHLSKVHGTEPYSRKLMHSYQDETEMQGPNVLKKQSSAVGMKAGQTLIKPKRPRMPKPKTYRPRMQLTMATGVSGFGRSENIHRCSLCNNQGIVKIVFKSADGEEHRGLRTCPMCNPIGIKVAR